MRIAVADNRNISGVFLLPTHKKLALHELKVHEALAKKIAALLGTHFLGSYDLRYPARGWFYFVPSDTLIGDEPARMLEIASEDHFFGGWVQEPFMATKAITHPLVKADAQAPRGWSTKFSQKTGDAILNGRTAFNLNDTQRAGTILLANGAVRIKPVRACAGRGQQVVTNREELASVIANIDEEEIATWGVVLEEDLAQVNTYSVGQATVANTTISYVGTQSLTQDNNGETVYGGSSLLVTRGSYKNLLTAEISDKEILAIAQARTYEAAAISAFPGLRASRRNYDIAQGFDSEGKFHSGVLEQSWRIGGASGAEIFALEAFAADPQLKFVHASTHEVYGPSEPPADATVLYRDTDPDVGYITKFVRVKPYVHNH